MKQNNKFKSLLQRVLENAMICIPVFWICDSVIDCPFGSDEQACSCANDFMIQCLGKDKLPICMPITWACNGYPLCTEYSTSVCDNDVDTKPEHCKYNEIWCHFNDTCLIQSNVCDDVDDCIGGEDKAYCKGNNTHNSNNRIFSYPLFV